MAILVSTLPELQITNWRVFAVTNYSQGAKSPKSNTLIFNIVAPGAITISNFWKFILSLLALPMPIILESHSHPLNHWNILLNKKKTQGKSISKYTNLSKYIKTS